MTAYPEYLGEPALSIGPLHLWIHGREFESSDDYWDGNWLRVTAHCTSPHSDVSAAGSFLHLSELKHWLDSIVALRQSLAGQAELKTMEPNLSASIELRDGRGTLNLNITADHLVEQHAFKVEVDQTHLVPLERSLDAILRDYQLRGNPQS